MRTSPFLSRYRCIFLFMLILLGGQRFLEIALQQSFHTVAYAQDSKVDPAERHNSGAALNLADERAIGVVSGVIGKVSVVRNGRRYRIIDRAELFRSDRILVEKLSFIKVLLVGGESFMLGSGSSLDLEKQEFKAGKLESIKHLLRGTIHFFVNPARSVQRDVQFKAGIAVLGVRGTSGIIKIDPSGRVTVALLEGELEAKNVSNEEASVILKEGQLTLIEKNKPPFPPRPFTNAESRALKDGFGKGKKFDSKTSSERIEDIRPNNEKLEEEEGEQNIKDQEGQSEDKRTGQRAPKRIEKPIDGSAVKSVEARENLSRPVIDADDSAKRKTDQSVKEANRAGKEKETTFDRVNEVLNTLSESAKEKATELQQQEKPQVEIKIPDKPAQ